MSSICSLKESFQDVNNRKDPVSVKKALLEGILS